MDYWKIKQSIRKKLEEEGERISDRAEARTIRMSQRGYTAMMKNETMTVKKLEKIAEILNKPVSYFLVENENIESNHTNEPSGKYNNCPECSKKQEKINELLEKNSELYEKYSRLLENKLYKKETGDDDSAQYGQAANE